MDRNAVNPPSEKLFKCKGSSEQVEAARQMIAEKINMDLPIISRKPISGMPTGPQGSTSAYNPNDPNAMAAYQQQWAGYAAQQSWPEQASQAAIGQAPNVSGQPADYSQQWIIYYKYVYHYSTYFDIEVIIIYYHIIYFIDLWVCIVRLK